MQIEVKRKWFSNISTIGELYIDNKFYCYTLEDVVRPDNAEKIYGKTAIPYGTYKITLRKEGTIYADYCKRFNDIGQERGTLWIRNIPNYEYVLIHIGNTDIDTLGCLLVGDKKATDKIIDSTIAYKKIYPIIASAIEKGDDVKITYTEVR